MAAAQNRLVIARNFLDDVSPELYECMKKVLHQKGGKRGCIILQGPPDCGKSIVVKLFSAAFDLDRIGIITRIEGDTRFQFQDLNEKDCWVAEEMTLSDVAADSFKLMCEGSRFFTIEEKHKGLMKVKRKPLIVTSNFHICVMCPRQWAPIKARSYFFGMNTPVPEDADINFIHTMSESSLMRLGKALFEIE